MIVVDLGPLWTTRGDEDVFHITQSESTYVNNVGPAPVCRSAFLDGVLDPLQNSGVRALLLGTLLVLAPRVDLGPQDLIGSSLGTALPFVNLLLALQIGHELVYSMR